MKLSTINEKFNFMFILAPIELSEDNEGFDAFSVVLLHEVQILNQMLRTTVELFAGCSNAMLGKQLVTGQVEMVMEALNSNTILEQLQVRSFLNHIVEFWCFQNYKR